MLDKIYSVIDTIDESKLKKTLDEVKIKINNSDKTKKLIDKFNNAKEFYEKYDYKEEYVKAKIDLMKDPLIKAYLDIQNEINLLSLQINDRINKITKGK